MCVSLSGSLVVTVSFAASHILSATSKDRTHTRLKTRRHAPPTARSRVPTCSRWRRAGLPRVNTGPSPCRS
eukprot:6016984-Pleurochrysis_carterae.AAC.1